MPSSSRIGTRDAEARLRLADDANLQMEFQNTAHGHILVAHYDRLVAAGKRSKVAVVACTSRRHVIYKRTARI
jgi:hypothetical protein